MTQKRYTIHFAIHEVDEEGDTSDQEVAGITLDYTDDNLEAITGRMGYFFEMANDGMANQLYPPRRPEPEIKFNLYLRLEAKHDGDASYLEWEYDLPGAEGDPELVVAKIKELGIEDHGNARAIMQKYLEAEGQEE